MESWLPIEGFYPFEISNEGRVRNSKTGKIRKPLYYNRPAIVLQREGTKKTTTRLIDKLVTETFFGRS